jgi:hypothetical protein
MIEEKDIVPLSRACRKYVTIMTGSTRLSMSLFKRLSSSSDMWIASALASAYFATSASIRS